jgi:Flp pilus assembly pilin Flp
MDLSTQGVARRRMNIFDGFSSKGIGGHDHERNDRHSGTRQWVLGNPGPLAQIKKRTDRKEKVMPRLNEKGQGLVEYILVVVVMAILAIGVIQRLGRSTQHGFTQASDGLDRAFGG